MLVRVFRVNGIDISHSEISPLRPRTRTRVIAAVASLLYIKRFEPFYRIKFTRLCLDPRPRSRLYLSFENTYIYPR